MMYRLIFLSPLFFTFLCTKICTGQTYDVKHIALEHNSYSATLPKRIHINRDGFYWYTTYNGFVKEYGNHTVFTPYHHPKGKEITIAHDIYESTNNVLWITNKQGLFKKDLHTGGEEWFFIDQTHNVMNEKIEFKTIFEGSDQNIWFGSTGNYIYKYDGDQLHTIPLHSIPLLRFNRNMSIVSELEDGALLLKYANNWYYYKEQVVEKIYVESDHSSTNLNTHTFSADNGQFFKENTSGRYMYNNKAYRFWYVPKIKRHIFEVPFTYESLLLKEENNGPAHLYVNNSLSIDELVFTEKEGHITLNVDKKFSTSSHIWSYDVVDNTIVATPESGLNVYRPRPAFFTSYIQENPPISTRGFSKDSQDNLYLSSHQGIYKKEKTKNTFTHISLKDTVRNISIEEHVFLYNYEMLSDTTALLYGYSKELNISNLTSGTFKKIPYNGLQEAWPILSTTYDVFPITADSLLIGNTNGLFLYELTSNRYTDLNQLDSTTTIKGTTVKDIHFNKQRNELWIGTEKQGLYLKRMHTGEVIHFATSSTEFPICDNFIEYIFEDKDSIIWIATKRGLQRIDPITLNSEEKSKDKGFKDLHLVGILENESTNDLWMSTYNGLIKYNKETEQINDFYEIDGIPNNEFNAKSFFKQHDSLFYFGGINGIVAFNPNKVFKSKQTSKLFLTEVVKYDDSLKVRKTYSYNLENQQRFTLPYNHNYISLAFALNDITRAEDCIFQYKIKSINDEWVDLKDYNKVQLQGLQPATYELLVRGFNSAGYPAKSLSYTIVVEDVFYNTHWFRFLMLSLIIASIILWQYLRKKALIETFNRKNEIRNLEAKALRAQMNPHFIFNCLNGIQSTMILEGEEAANIYLSAFSKLLRSTLDMTHSETITLDDEIAYLKAYITLEKMRLDGDLHTTFEVSEDLDTHHIKIPCMLFQPIVENAIIHGLVPKKGTRNITVTFYSKDDYFIGEITDNGIGRAAATLHKASSQIQHQSWATRIMKERIDISNSKEKNKIQFDIVDLYDDEVATGTRVIIKIPLKESMYLE